MRWSRGSTVVPAVAFLSLVATSAVVRPFGESAFVQRVPNSLGTPTGREPRLIWTPQRQATLARMRADYEANPTAPPTSGGRYYAAIKQNAECKCRYADTGLWATLMFQATGDQKYAELAWRAIESWFFARSGSQLGGNFAREYSAELVLQDRLAVSGPVEHPARDIPVQAQSAFLCCH